MNIAGNANECLDKIDKIMEALCWVLLTAKSTHWLGYGLDDTGSESRQQQEILVLSRSRDRVWIPPALLFEEYRGAFPAGKEEKTWSWPLTPTPRFRIGGAIPFLPPVCLRGMDSENFRFIKAKKKVRHVQRIAASMWSKYGPGRAGPGRERIAVKMDKGSLW